MVDLSKYKAAPLTGAANYLLIPVTVIPISDDGVEEFNEILRYHQNLKFYNKITRTKSGGISLDRRVYRPPMWDVRRTRSCVEITSLLADGMRRFQFRDPISKFKLGENDMNIDNTTIISGSKAIKIFANKLKRISDIDLTDYAIDNGLEIRDTVPRYLIKVNPKFIKETMCIEDAIGYSPAHHIDFHSSFGAGLANTHPEFRDTIQYFFDHRKRHPEYKSVLNSTIGAMWSPYYKNACYAHLSRDAIADNNARIERIEADLIAAGRIPLLWNVDGLWYLGEEYHGPGEGPGLGQWENDHKNCKLRVKTRGAYEFIEDGIYYPVVRGIPNDEKANWTWGDIFKYHPSPFGFDEQKGVYMNETIQI